MDNTGRPFHMITRTTLQAYELRKITNRLKADQARLRGIHNALGCPSITVRALEAMRVAEASLLEVIL